MIHIILVLAVQSCLGYRNRNCPAAVVDRESSHVCRNGKEFYVFYDLYDVVEVMGSSSSSSMVETAASSASDKIVSKGGFEISTEDLKTAAKEFNVSAKGLNVSQKAFSHSKLMFCETTSQLTRFLKFLDLNIRKKNKKIHTVKQASLKSVECVWLSFGPNKNCTEKACGIRLQTVKFYRPSTLYNREHRVPLGLACIESGHYDDNPLEPLVDIIRTKKDQWKGSDWNAITHNSNTFAGYVVKCVLKMKMPTLGANHAVSSASSTKWIASIGATVAGALVAGPFALLLGPALFAAMPGKFCD